MQKLIRIATIPVALKVLLQDQLKFMSSYYDVIAVSSNDPLLRMVEKEQQVKTVGINMTRTITPFKDLSALWKLYSFLKREKPLIVHTHTPKAGLLGMIAAKLTNVPIRLHTVAGLPLTESTGVKRKVLEIVEKITYLFASKVYPNSFVQARFIVDNKFANKNKIKVIGNGSSNGIDTTYFNPDLYDADFLKKTRNEIGIDENDTVLCFVGRVVKDKGVTELVSQFIELQKDYKNLKLLIVGPFEPDLDPLDDYTEKQIKNNAHIKWLGFQNDVRPYLCIAHLFVFPSYREGFPNVVMQAGAMGLPCVVSDINGCSEIIENNKNGLVVKAKSTKELKDAILLLLNDKELRGKMASVSREMIVSRFERRYLWQKLLEEYEFQEMLINLKTGFKLNKMGTKCKPRK